MADYRSNLASQYRSNLASQCQGLARLGSSKRLNALSSPTA